MLEVSFVFGLFERRTNSELIATHISPSVTVFCLAEYGNRATPLVVVVKMKQFAPKPDILRHPRRLFTVLSTLPVHNYDL